MKNILKKLILLMLRSDKWVTAKILASKLGVSERSVKKYIAEINTYMEGGITSSRQGYKANKEIAKKILMKFDTPELPQTPLERQNYITFKMIENDKHYKGKINLYQISEELFVSYETVRNDVKKIKDTMGLYNIEIIGNGEYIAIEGKEVDKRKLLSKVLYDEFNYNVMSISVMTKKFPEYDFELLISIIKKGCAKFNYFINDYALLNLIVDIVIGVDRIKNMKTARNPRLLINEYRPIERELILTIAKEIERNFEIQYSDIELEELSLMLLSHVMIKEFMQFDKQNIETIVGSECIIIVKDIMCYLNSAYFIDTRNEEFFVKFALHLKNLIRRLENNYESKNPLTNHIKRTCPLIYDAAVGVADKLNEFISHEITEDEIAYIALHIGGNLETQQKKMKRVKCVIVFPQYYNFTFKFVENIKNIFDQKIEIIEVITSTVELVMSHPIDLVITTVSIPEFLEIETVEVTPFLREKDCEKIENKIKNIVLKKEKKKFFDDIMQMYNPRFFCKNDVPNNKSEVIKFMTNIMEEEGVVTQEYYKEVIRRENQASTAFGNIAVPHSMKMNALKTRMFVMLNSENPIDWDGCSVNVVLLFAICEDEKQVFHDVFDKIVVLLLEQENIMKVKNTDSYLEFANTLVDCL